MFKCVLVCLRLVYIYMGFFFVFFGVCYVDVFFCSVCVGLKRESM